MRHKLLFLPMHRTIKGRGKVRSTRNNRLSLPGNDDNNPRRHDDAQLHHHDNDHNNADVCESVVCLGME